jgi:hypothetical protein
MVDAPGTGRVASDGGETRLEEVVGKKRLRHEVIPAGQ